MNAIFRVFITACLSLYTSVMLAAEPIMFKQAFSPKHGWVNYGVVIAILLIFILILAKKHKPQTPPLAGCQLIEKKHLGNKTIVYIIDYQQQRFLLADNQQALAIHPLEKATHDTTCQTTTEPRPFWRENPLANARGSGSYGKTLTESHTPNHHVTAHSSPRRPKIEATDESI